MQLIRLATLVVGSLAVASVSWAADVTFIGNFEDGGLKEARFQLKGEITSSDVGNVKAALMAAKVSYQSDPWRQIVIALDSPGGSYHAGIDLALLFRRQGISTIVSAGDRCYSACAIAFLGGSEPPKDATPSGDDSQLPAQLPKRSLAAGAELGFHAPYLNVPAASYTSQAVEAAYRSAVLGIARLVAVSDRLYVPSAELPRLLKPERDEVFVTDTVDAVRSLDIDYTDRSLQFRYLPGFTPSMLRNACINRYYHLQRRSSLEGFAIAASVVAEFIEGSKLLSNGEEKLAFGVRRMKQGTLSTWAVFTPIARSDDGRSFVWCIATAGPEVFYRIAGTARELFEGPDGGDLFKLRSSPKAMKIGADSGMSLMLMRVFDMAPPDTKLIDVALTIQRYLKEEKIVR